jgi:predicted enzyme related to lactoylglutathione lyase
MPMTFGCTVLFVDDVPAVLDFYNRACGFATRFYDPAYGYGELDAGGATLAVATHACGESMIPGGYARPADGRPAGVEVAFFTPDVAGAYERVVAAGATPLAAPRAMPWGQTVAYVAAVEGTILGFCSPPAGPAPPA